MQLEKNVIDVAEQLRSKDEEICRLREICDSLAAQANSLEARLLDSETANAQREMYVRVLEARLEAFQLREQSQFAEAYRNTQKCQALQNHQNYQQAVAHAQMQQDQMQQAQQQQAQQNAYLAGQLNQLSDDLHLSVCNCIPDRASMLARLSRYIQGA